MGHGDHLRQKIKDEFKSLLKCAGGNKDQDDEEEEEYRAEGHRHESFAPVRHDAMFKFFIDGHDYCWAVAEAIENAQEVVFIADWWLSPELYLKRPPAKYPEFRIDALLKRKAEEGVKFFIVVYKEVEVAMTLDSAHTKKALQELHENIVVQRHPDHSVGDTFFWSHHEKFVVVDNNIAFLGGIDLCFGRWDTHAHRLADFTYKDPYLEIYPGQDYSDARLADFKDVKEWDLRLTDKTIVPRMPWHDISLCMLGHPVLDVSRHFCDRWNYVKQCKSLDKSQAPFLKPPVGGYSSYQNFRMTFEEKLLRSYHYGDNIGNIEGTCRAQILRSAGEWSTGVKLEHSIQNAYIDTIAQSKYYIYIENQFFITTTENESNFIIKNQIGDAIVKRICKAHEEKEKYKVFVLIPLLPAFPAELSTKDAATARLVMYYQYISICSGDKSIFGKLRKAGINPEEYIKFYSLRSYDRINRPLVEEMLARDAGYTPHDARGAPRGNEHETDSLKIPSQHHQQRRHHAFPGGFIDPRTWSHEQPEQEHHDNHTGFAGGFIDPNTYHPGEHQDNVESHTHGAFVAAGSVAPDAMNNHQHPITQEPWVHDTSDSQPRDRKAELEEAFDYVSEELYIHAKLLIADDRVVIMGSANLNDRSQCGDRDSEIAVIVEDKDMIPSMMNDEPYQAGRFAATLRRNLWKEHLGLIPEIEIDIVTDAMLPLPVPQIDTTRSSLDQMVMDPLSNQTLDLWNTTAATNTAGFRNVFHCVPDDTITNWKEYHAFYPNPDKIDLGHVYDPNMSVQDIRKHLDTIRGHLVEFPIKFLSSEDLQGEAIPLVGGMMKELYT